MIAIVASILLVGVPFMVQAAQITANPNPKRSTIDIINDPVAENTASPFVNAGTLIIDFLNTGALNNAGTFDQRWHHADQHWHTGPTSARSIALVPGRASNVPA